MLDFSSPCCFCPHHCHAMRQQGETGFCGLDDQLYISSICRHRGEEPAISGATGICNVFFAHCNLQCIYCQNHQISDNRIHADRFLISLHEVCDRITALLDTGISSVGFVSPSHQIPQMIQIIETLHKRNYFPLIIYNTNSYDSVDTLIAIENYVDVYLADLKYYEDNLAFRFSGVHHYSGIARAAIREMIRQKGINLITNAAGLATKGVIVRHLVLPGHIDNTIAVLNAVADELNPKITLSLMAQYYPSHKAGGIEGINRTLYPHEYERVLSYMEFLGIENGWIQELESQSNYLPDFTLDDPFEPEK
ncbi:MAG: 4Fe-4S cluster-binding domain-containing protein [Bacteroidales bacterium]|nr:4Fe-4S cluster-binding domain-containing protein [Bacteroidales bacterium]MDD3010143.1 4Fe-4S cluster-binding domain-containing protein [Bacteroidales bacterium]MDY0286313.1 4Fe-4S cluster-binding domain-containing protein [Bacteroidales bacterium]